MRSKSNRGNNLFSIDFEVIENTLTEANAELISRILDLERSGKEISDIIESNDTATDIRDYLRQLRLLLKEVAQARLSDRQPFSAAEKIITKWFGSYENKLKVLDKQLAHSLSKYTADLAAKADEIKISSQSEKVGPIISPQTETVVGETSGGDAVVSVNKLDVSQDHPAPQEIKIPDIAMEWEMKDFDRRMIDLEQLRDHFSDNALAMAINRRLRQTGDRSLTGVVYHQVVSRKL